MANGTKAPTPTWTTRDEETLRNLTERKERFMTTARAPVEEIVITLTPGNQTGLEKTPVKQFALRKWMVDMMINNADQIRDALAPFDSGVRVKPEESQP